MSTPTLSMMAAGVSPPLVSAPRHSESIAPLSPSARVVSPSTPSKIIGHSSGVVTRIPSVPYTYSPFMQNNKL